MTMTTYQILEEALEIIGKDVEKIKVLATSEGTLDKTEASKLTDYIKTLINVHKEEREQNKADSLLTKTDTEMEDLVAEAIEFLKVKPENKEPDTETTDDSKDTANTTQTDGTKGQ